MRVLTERLTEALAVCEAATRGPWEFGPLSDEAQSAQEKSDAMRDMIQEKTDSLWVAWSPNVSGEGSLVHAIAGDHERSPANAAFAAHARTGYPAALRALQAVVELHKPEFKQVYAKPSEQDYDICAECVKDAETEGTIAWPCPTVRAVIEHLGGAQNR